jgi:hypothetical protein
MNCLGITDSVKQENNSAYHCIIQHCRKRYVYVENHGVYNHEDLILAMLFFQDFQTNWVQLIRFWRGSYGGSGTYSSLRRGCLGLDFRTGNKFSSNPYLIRIKT